MNYFEFSMDVIPCVIKELRKAEKYIRIAIFQMHHQDLFDLLKEKLKNGVRVEILTLPYDAINESVQARVMDQFQELENLGATLHFCRWNIGDPGNTDTVTGRWYSFHGKFIVTDKASISLSANFTDNCELDAALIFVGEEDKQKEFNQKFDELLNLFVKPYAGYSGQIRSRIENSGYENPKTLFQLPRGISGGIHDRHWILQYPGNICPTQIISEEDGLYILPFDGRARNLFQDIIMKSEKIIYISTESFTDPDICDDLIKARIAGIQIKVITGTASRDYSEKVQKLLRNLLASGIEIHTTNNPLHAKVIITNNIFSLSSVNLNKMNLGFPKSNKSWRSNTETIYLSKDIKIIDSAIKQFECIFNSLSDVRLDLARRLEKDVSNLFNKYYGLYSRKEAKELFSQFFLSQEIEVKKVALKIGKIVKKLMGKEKYVTKNIFIKAVTLHFLSDNKLTINQISEKLSVLNTKMDLHRLLDELIENNYIEQEGIFYKLQVLKMF